MVSSNLQIAPNNVKIALSNNSVNLDIEREGLSLNNDQKIIIAGFIAEDTLKHTNEISELIHVNKNWYTLFGKRALDIIVSLIALIITLPINLVLAICTYFDVGRPIFFKQERPGKDGKTFTIIKFRNMTNDRDENGVLLPPRKRVTKFGKLMRKTSLDELLNFWSILKGDMSLIGPRPLKMEYETRYSERHKMKQAVRPGLECPLIRKLDGPEFGWQGQFENNVWYVENVSFLVDLKMMLKLVSQVFDRKTTALRGAAKRSGFMGYDKKGIAYNVEQIPQKYIDRLIAQESKKEKSRTDKPRKICIGLFIRGFHNGGIEKVFESYYSHMDLSRFDIHVVTHMQNNPQKEAVFINMGCTIHRLSKVHGHKLKRKNIQEYSKLFKENTFDIVHHNMPDNLLPLFFAKRYKVKRRILHAHNNYTADYDKKNKLVAAAYKLGFALNTGNATVLLTVSRLAAVSAFGERKGNQAKILSNAIEVKRFRFNKSTREEYREELGLGNEFVIGHIGRYENDQKNQEFVLEVFQELLKLKRDCRLLMIGDGMRLSEFKTMAKEMGIADKVIFTGSVPNIPDYLQAMDMFLLPSRKEGLGIVAVEAQAAGLYCIVSDMIPQEVKVTDNIEFLSIVGDKFLWVDSILTHAHYQRSDTTKQIEEAGYDINREAEVLERIYLV